MDINLDEYKKIKDEYNNKLNTIKTENSNLKKRTIDSSLANEVIKLWDNASIFKEVREILTTLLKPIKDNKLSEYEIIQSLLFIDYFYNTHLAIKQAFIIASYLIENKDIKADPKIIDTINTHINLKVTKKRHETSFLSKLYFLLYPDAFPIYDSNAREVLEKQKIRSFEESTIQDQYTYCRYVEDINKSRKELCFSSTPSYSEFDKFLWLYGHIL